MKVHGNGDKWSRNALVFATKQEAEENAHDLFMRWTACDEWRVVEVDEPVSHTYRDGKLEHL
jgi:hypothetical protein